jgi:predicted MPP superfamily phosphohydrolase
VKKLSKPLGFALTINLLIVAADLVARPLHAAGQAQTLLSYFLGATHLLNLPGFIASEWAGTRPDHRWTWAAFTVGTAINFPFWLITAILLTRLKRKYAPNMAWAARPSFPIISETKTASDLPFAFATTPSPDPEHETASLAPQKLSRRNLLLHTTRFAAATTLALTSYGLFAEARWFEITRRQIRIKGLSPGLDGLRIVQLSDIHHSAWMTIQWVREIVQAANDLAPDLVALTGDYVYHGLDYVGPVAHELARLTPRIGTLAVMGNHDWYDGGGLLTKRLFATQGLPLIDNTRMCITPNRKLVRTADEGLCIAGVGDLWNDKCLYDQAFDDLPGKMPRILLSHNPDVAEEPDFLKSGQRVDLMLSGHTHGGQISIPGLGAPVTNSAYGQKYAKGLVQSPTCPVFISKGLGMTVMPIRLGVRPEIAVIELRSA